MIHKISRRLLFGSVLTLLSCMTLSAQDNYVPYSQRTGDYKDTNVDPYSSKKNEKAEPYKSTSDEDYKLNYGRRTYIPDVNHSPEIYNNFIVGEYKKVLKKQLRYIKISIYSDNEASKEGHRNDVIGQLDRSIYKLNQIENYDSLSTFLDEFVVFMTTVRSIYDIELKRTDELAKSSSSSFEAMQNYFNQFDKVDAKANAAALKVVKAQKEFADRHKMILVIDDEEFEKELEKTHNALEYSQDIYLLYFKVAKINSYFVDAFNADDLPMMKRKQKELLAATIETSNTLKAKETFEGNVEYKSSAGKLIKFYQTMAKSKYNKIIELYEEFGDRESMEEVDIQKLNNIITQYNTQSEDLYDTFIKAKKKLLKENIKRES